MKTKLIFSILIAAIFIAAMYFFNKISTLSEIILAFVGASGTIGWLWKWFDAKEAKEEAAFVNEVAKAKAKEVRELKFKLQNLKQ